MNIEVKKERRKSEPQNIEYRTSNIEVKKERRKSEP